MDYNPFTEARETLEEAIQIRKARTNYLEYVKLTNPIFIETEFHRFLTREVQDFIERDTGNAVDILLISVPPQHGKSITITEALPSWYLMKNPDHKVIIASYNEEFAKTFGRRNKEKIRDWAQKMFPEVELDPSTQSNTHFGINNRRGACISRGIMSGITGHAGNLIIIDDPIKNRQEADSATTRESIWSEYLNSIRTRFQARTKLIVIQTRWHEDDLYGRLKEREKNVKVINIPCECDDEENDLLHRKLGQALCPEIGKGQAWLEDYKHAYLTEEGSRAWQALFQGRPTAMEGNLFKREFWKYYSQEEISDLPYKIISVDAAFKGGEENDFVAIQVWGKRDKKYYLLDLLKEHLTFTETIKAIKNFKVRHPDTLYILIEDKANGSAIVDVLSKEFTGVLPVQPEGGKEARANAILPTVEMGRVFLPEYGGKDIAEFIQECSEFPHSSHDDQVDAFTQALSRMIFVDANIIDPQKIVYREWTEDMFQDYNNASANLELQNEMLKLWGHPSNFEYEYTETEKDDTHYDY
ncbi:MAG: phage terminase large subunit [Desulfuromonadaceae bacterium]|nr:phage terminase large subunit [Desulfuromonadaceae bacterium]